MKRALTFLRRVAIGTFILTLAVLMGAAGVAVMIGIAGTIAAYFDLSFDATIVGVGMVYIAIILTYGIGRLWEAGER